MHEGHRKRMYEKLRNGDSLNDHEILEVFLFNACPRKNTNPIAHELLDKFGSLSGVFSASEEQLVTVDGVGQNVATFIKCVAECNRRIALEFAGIAVLKNYADFKNFTVARMRRRNTEILELYCMDKNGKVTSINSFTNEDMNKVEISADKISRVLAIEKPYGILLAHNHLSGLCMPSSNDDRFTSQLQLLCSMHNVRLYDHCIYASDTEVYSYHGSGELDKIKKDFSFNKVVDEQYKRLLKNDPKD